MMEEKSAFENFEFNVPPIILGFLKETSTWTYFLSIIGFIGLGLMIIAGLIFTITMGNMVGDNPYESLGIDVSYFGMIYIILGLIYLIPIVYLFNFSRKMKRALSSNSNEDLNAAFSNLKSHYKYLGIFTILIISLYVLALVITMIAGTMY